MSSDYEILKNYNTFIKNEKCVGKIQLLFC